MSYDIPDKVRYKEKIFLNLDMKQLAYFVGFAMLAGFSYKLPLQNEAKLVLPSFAILLGIGFAFLGFERILLERVSYLRNVRIGGALDKKVRAFVGVKRIESDTVYLENGESRAILLVKPVNFELLDDGRQKSIILNYRDFLNQLPHPIQIVVRTVNVSLADYFSDHEAKILRTKDESLIGLYNDFRVYEEKFLKEHFVKERLYYVVVPISQESTTIHKERQLKKLEERVRIIQSKLGNCGLTSYRLNTNQLVSLIMSYFEGYVEVNEDYLWRVSVCQSFFKSKERDKPCQNEKKKQ
ncbi:Uncharacterised protein [uncultured archaeon]|nr:Uncharacterised protein [uncultured archaeon]